MNDEINIKVLGEAKDEYTLNKAYSLIEEAGQYTNYDFKYYYYKAKADIINNDHAAAEKNLQKAHELAPNNMLINEALKSQNS